MKMASYVTPSIALTLGTLLNFSLYASDSCLVESSSYSHPLKVDQKLETSSRQQVVLADLSVVENKTFSKTSLLEDHNKAKNLYFLKLVPSKGK